MTTETIKTNPWATAKKRLDDCWYAVRSHVEEYWAVDVLAISIAALIAWAAVNVHRTNLGVAACNSGNTNACRAYVQQEDEYDSQRVLLQDYKLATGHELK